MENDAEARLSRILREAREASCRTQEHVAEESGLSVPTISRAERTGRIGDESLRAICAVVGLDAEEVRARAAAAAGSDAPHDRVALPQRTRFERDNHRPREDRIDRAFAWLQIPSLLLIFLAMDIPSYFSLAFTAFFGLFPLALADNSALDSLVKLQRHRRMFSTAWRSMKAASLVVCTIILTTTWSYGADHATKANEAVVPISMFLLILIQSVFVGGIAERSVKSDLEAHLARARELFLQRTPAILSEIRGLIDGQQTAETAGHLRSLVEEAVELAVEIRRGQDATALVLLEEDFARRVSGRKALMDYLRVAEAALAAERPLVRQQRDIDRAVDRLEGRLSAYA